MKENWPNIVICIDTNYCFSPGLAQVRTPSSLTPIKSFFTTKDSIDGIILIRFSHVRQRSGLQKLQVSLYWAVLPDEEDGLSFEACDIYWIYHHLLGWFYLVALLLEA